MASSLTQLLYTARDGLTAQSYGLGVTGQNISNVNTPGYVRREAVLETRALGDNNTGSVNAAGIRRATDVFIERRQFETTGLTSAASEHDKNLANVEGLFNDQSGTGLGTALDNVFKSFSALASNPSDPTARRTVSQAAEDFTARVRDGATIILTTHILEVAERLADRIGIVHRGRLAAEGTLAELKTAAGRGSSTLEDVFLTLMQSDVDAAALAS